MKKKSYIKISFTSTSLPILLRNIDKIGTNVYIGNNARIGISRSATLIIKDGTQINDNLEISCNSFIEIGENVLIGRNVFIGDNIHNYERIYQPIIKQQLSMGGKTIIEDDCWIGTGSCVLKDVVIGKHSIVGANSVVTKDIPPYSVSVGIPAKVVKKYDFEKERWIKI
ncbi:acyltransferase [Methanosarcina mazei]|uniref:acyltransferase n=1 Tax=Methanosarcina mazei TaxID=2209 RepID=UPI00064FF23F|nr:acyltransferase [Methanosarcina mazei]